MTKSIRDMIREEAHEELFDFVNWIAEEHPDIWGFLSKQYIKKDD